MKKIFLLLAIFVILSAFIFAAGGGQQQSVSGSQPASTGKTEIRASWWGDARRTELYDSIVDEFEKANPGITVIREPAGIFDSYWEKFPVQVAGGNAPDFVCMHPRFSADYIPRGVLEALDPYIADGTLSTAGWPQSAIDTGRWSDGKIYMMAMGITYVAAITNIGVFKDLGVPPPNVDWSWEDARRIGIQVRAAFDSQGKRANWMLQDHTFETSMNNFRYYVRQQGREQYNADGSIGFTQQDVENWFAMHKEFRDLGVIPDAATSTEYLGAVLENSLFAKDMALINFQPANQFWMYNTTLTNKEMGLIRIAGSANSVQAGEFPEGAHYGVYSRSTPEKKNAAVKLINFWLNDPRSLVLYKLDQGVPANAPVLEQSVIPILDPYSVTVVNFVNTLAKITTPSPNPPPGISEISQEYLNAAQQVAFNAKTPAQAAKDFYEQAQAIIARNRR